MNYRKLVPMCTAAGNTRLCDYYQGAPWDTRSVCLFKGSNGECEKEVPERDR